MTPQSQQKGTGEKTEKKKKAVNPTGQMYPTERKSYCHKEIKDAHNLLSEARCAQPGLLLQKLKTASILYKRWCKILLLLFVQQTPTFTHSKLTLLKQALMQRWKQSSEAASAAAHFKSIPFPGHQAQQQRGKPSLILPLLSGSLMVFMHCGTPPARRPIAPEHQKWC